MYYTSTEQYDKCRQTLVTLSQWNPVDEDLQIQGSEELKRVPKGNPDSDMTEKVALKVFKELESLQKLQSASLYAINAPTQADFRDIQVRFERLQVITKAWKESQNNLKILTNRVREAEQAMNGLTKWFSNPVGHANLKKAIETIQASNDIPESMTQQTHVGRNMEIITETIIRESKTPTERRAYHIYERTEKPSIYSSSTDNADRSTTVFLMTIVKNPPGGYKKLNDIKEYISEKTMYGPEVQNPLYMDLNVSSSRDSRSLSFDLAVQIIHEVKPCLVSHWESHKIPFIYEKQKYRVDEIHRPDPFLLKP